MERLEFIKNELNSKAKSLQVHSEGEIFWTKNGIASHKFYKINAPQMTLSFTRPFYIQGGKLRETIWYKGFRVASKQSFLTFSQLKNLFGAETQVQTIRYSEYLNKVKRGLYQPTKKMINLVNELEDMKYNLLGHYYFG